MAVGSWSIDLVPDCPQWIRDEFMDNARGLTDRWKSHVVFLESDVIGWEGRGLPQTDIDEMADAALYTGSVWERSNKLRHFAGPGLIGWMDNDRGGAYASGASATPSFPATISQIVADWFDPAIGGRNGIRLGGAASPNLSTVDEMLNGTYLPPLKIPLDEVMAQTNNEYYVRAANRINWGNAQDLFEYPPKILIAEQLNTHVPGYKVLNVPADGISRSDDIYGWRNVAKVISEDYDLDTLSGSGFADSPAGGGAQVFNWPRGGSVNMSSPIIRINSNDFSDVTAVAQAAADFYADQNRVISVEADDPCVLADLRPGDWVAIYDPQNDIIDTGNELTAAGQPIHPEWVRTVAVHQPFNPGMGAYVCCYAGSNTWNVTRITDYIADESGPCTIEIGTKPRPVVPSKYASYIDG